MIVTVSINQIKFFTMKSLKITLVSLFSLILIVPQFGQSAERTLVKSFNVKNVETINFNIEGDVEVKKWSKDLMRIELKISLENGTDHLLKSMVIANRFNLDSELSEGEMTIFAPSLENKITIGGKEIHEKITYTVNVPEGVLTNVLEKETLTLAEKEEK